MKRQEEKAVCKPRREACDRPSLMALRRNNIYQHFDLGLLAHRTEKINCYCLSHCNSGTLLQYLWQTSTPCPPYQQFVLVPKYPQNPAIPHHFYCYHHNQDMANSPWILATGTNWSPCSHHRIPAAHPGHRRRGDPVKCTSNNETPLPLT